MKRLTDIVLSFAGLLALSPLLLPVIFLIWLQDRHSPFYIAPRVGLNERSFKMVKLRSMIMNADTSGVDSTSANDTRITAIGHFVRKYKLDELGQLWNVLRGDMSLVGPRPNVERETTLYTSEEKKLLNVRPGITDIASIVFSDEGEILADEPDPDLAYNQLIRPWKSRLGIIYTENSSLLLDAKLILLTIVAIVNREKALDGIQAMLRALSAPEDVIAVAKRKDKLRPHPPPGQDTIVQSR